MKKIVCALVVAGVTAGCSSSTPTAITQPSLHFGSSAADVAKALGCTFVPDKQPTTVGPKLSQVRERGTCELAGTSVHIGVYASASALAADITIATRLLSRAPGALYAVQGPGFIINTIDGSKAKAEPLAKATGGTLVNLTGKP